MKPNFLNRFMKKLTRDRVVPIISAKVSWLILAIKVSGAPSLPQMSKQHQESSQSFLAGIEELVD